MKLRIRAIKIIIKTIDKTFGSEFKFETSMLNVIRAENSKGKSTIYNSILYALGLEVLIGNSKHTPLTYVLTRTIEHGTLESSIEESYVLLEIENEMREIKTVRRGVVPSKTKNLVEVLDGPCITSASHSVKSIEQYYVHGSGSAQNEKGFYNWFTRFLGWNLPSVQRFNASDITLYLECIFPLFVVEQKKGWTQIQSGVPTQYGIKEVKKKALEFLLKLDSEKIESQRRELKNLMHTNAIAWQKIAQSIVRRLKDVDGTVENLPNDPKINLETDVKPIFKVNNGGKWILIREKVVDLENRLKKTISIISTEDINLKEEALTGDLNKIQSDLFHVETLDRNLTRQFSESTSELSLLEKRICNLDDDIRKMDDAFKISKLGGRVDLAVDLHNCPLCSSHLDGSTLSQDVERHLMSIEENVGFLKDERKAVEFLKTQCQLSQDLVAKEIAVVRKSADEFRDRIRTLKKSLVEDDRLPSTALLQEKIELKHQIQLFKSVEDDCRVDLQRLNELSKEYAALKKSLDAIPEEFSDSDIQKIKQLRDTLRHYLGEFGFSSFKPEQLEISEDTLHPIVEDFDWYFEASGSDNIRAIWAFTLSLLSVSKSFSMNHLGLVMYDEPGQHSAKGESLKAFFAKSATLCGEDSQIIITTSEPIKSLDSLLLGLPVKKFFFPDGVKLISEIKG